MKTMEIEQFVEEHILPHEDDKLALAYYRGEIDYDTEYLIERATELGIRLEK